MILPCFVCRPSTSLISGVEGGRANPAETLLEAGTTFTGIFPACKTGPPLFEATGIA